MAGFSPDAQFSEVKSGLENSLKDLFNFEGKRSKLTLHSVEVKDNKDSKDLRSQREALRKGRTWSVPVYGDVSLERNGKEVDRKKVLLMHLPKLTDRYGYIVNGNEYQVLNQFRLKSGVYHRVAPNGDALAEFNLANSDRFANGRSIKVRLDPASAIFYLKHGHSNVPLYPLLKELGVDDSTLKKAWGEKVFQQNASKAPRDKAMRAFVRAVTGVAPKNITEEHTQLLRDSFAHTELSAETTKKTLGKAFTTVTPEAVVLSTKNLLDITRGKRKEDDRNSLEFQSMHSTGDLISDQLRRSLWKVRRKINNTIDKKRSVRAVIPTDTFDRVVKGFFGTSLVTQGDQTNPLEMVSGSRKTTIMGELGGTKSAFAVTDESKLINPSHLGFMDPIHTPEGEKTGVTLALPLGARKKGTEIYARMREGKTGALLDVSAADSLHSTVAFPDQYEMVDGKLKPLYKRVKVTKDGDVSTADPKDVDYVFPSARGLFGLSSNMIPFLQNNQGNRAMTAARQQEQALPLVDREVPLVQAATDTGKSFEELVGALSSRSTPVDGYVDSVKKDAVVIKDSKGEKHEIQFYRDFALGGNSLYDSEVLVKAGDKVKKGDLLVDSTFTKGGTLALGTNLKAAYLPYFGYNFDDGIVISEKAAKKLTSLHIHRKDVLLDANTKIGLKGFLTQYPSVYDKTQLKGVGSDGVVKVGTVLRKGDPLVLALRKPDETKQRKQIHTFRRGRPDKWRDRSLAWDKPYEGVVTDVSKAGGQLVVYVKTKEPAQVGDKLVGRHGNKGVITRIIPQSQMPFKKGPDGEHEVIDIAFNPLGVPGRINLGQVLETAAGKIAAKNGKPILIKNFSPGVDYLEDIRSLLSSTGLADKDTLYDPRTGRALKEKVLNGQQYIFKLKHQATKKIAARAAGGGEAAPYDINHAPAGGSPHGGQSLGELGMYSLLAHGARNNLWEMYAYKSNKNDALWDALREGTPLPPPKVPFAYDKLLGYMNGLRINVRKEGNSLQLVPFTEKQVLGLSNGELKEPGLVVRGKDVRPLKHGLFDENITGGLEGNKWSHFNLPEPMPNPLFEGAIQKLTGLTGKKYRDLLSGKTEVKGKRGGEAVQALLEGINVDKELKAAEKAALKAKGAGRDKLHKKIRILKALKEQKLSPTVYMMKAVPVLPPIFRPVSVKEDGSLSSDDINGLYKDLGAVIEGFKLAKPNVPASSLVDMRLDMYDGLKALSGLGGSLTRDYRGIIDIIAGKTRERGGGSRGASKTGFFQKNVMKRRQDFTGRSIIIPEPAQGIDELGLPEDIAWEMYKPFIQRDLSLNGMYNIDALDEIDAKTPRARHSLGRAMEDRPILLKRDPALHKFNVMAFKPRLVKGKAIEVHPLITSGYNADFDGDAMSLYLPITEKARKEASSMYPSNNLFSPTTGAIMYTPGHEALLGMYLLSSPGKRTANRFKTIADALSAERKGLIDKTDIIHVGGAETTAGRLLIEEVLPPSLRETGKKRVRNMTVFDKKTVKKLLTTIAHKAPKSYGKIANRFKDLGNDYSTESGFSIGLSDFATINKKERDELLGKAEKEANKVRGNTKMTWENRKKKIVSIFSKADTALDKLNNSYVDKHPTNISTMIDSGSRGSRVQLNQIVSTPTLVLNAKSEVVPFLIPRSYSEGMDVASYWTTMHGARKGTVQKTQGVKEPGYLSKLLVNSMVDQVVTIEDCGTTNGIWMSINSSDVLDRYLAKGAKLGKRRYGRNTLTTPEMLSAAAASKTGSLYVRSPMTCEAEHGVCKKCMGLAEGGRTYDTGTNIGVIASQSIGEPSTQLSMNVFHCHHPETLVTLRCGGDPWRATMEDAFEELAGTVNDYGDSAEKAAIDTEIWDRGGWAKLRSIGRHMLGDSRMLCLLSESGHVQVLKETHPVMVWSPLLGDVGEYQVENAPSVGFQGPTGKYPNHVAILKMAKDVKAGDLVEIGAPVISPMTPGVLVRYLSKLELGGDSAQKMGSGEGLDIESVRMLQCVCSALDARGLRYAVSPPSLDSECQKYRVVVQGGGKAGAGSLTAPRLDAVASVSQVAYPSDGWVYDVTSSTGTFYAGRMWTHNTGGLAKGRGAKSANTFARLNELLKMPRGLPNRAPLALESGKVLGVTAAPQGGSYVRTKNVRHYVPSTQSLSVKKGDVVSKGDALTSDGSVDPKQLLPLKGLRAVQDYLAKEIHSVLKTATPIRRRNVEVVVKGMTNVTQIDDPGDHPIWSTGDSRSASMVSAWNRSNRGKAQVKHTPILKGIDVLPKELQEDWIARMNFQDLNRTLAQAAREGWRSNIHGFHPVPGLARATEFGQKKYTDWKGEF